MDENILEKKRKVEKEEEESKKPILPKAARRTSDWTTGVANLMNIKVFDEEFFTRKKDNNPLYLDFMSDDMWKSLTDIKSLSCGRDIKTLIFEVKRVYDTNNTLAEYFVDTYVYSLLYAMEMNFYPLTINAQHELIVQVGIGREEIKSIPNFIVKCEDSGMLVIIEDKSFKSASFVNQWKENQVLGEIFAAAHNTKFGSEFEIYGIRIIGTLFTFYKAKVTLDYIRESIYGIPKNNSLRVSRYPSPGNDPRRIDALDFCKLKDRIIIVEYLENIREALLKEL